MDESNDGVWFVPFPAAAAATATIRGTEDDLYGMGRRPPSPIHASTAMHRNHIYSANINKSLKSIVYDIIADAKDLGAIDLNWLLDYQHQHQHH